MMEVDQSARQLAVAVSAAGWQTLTPVGFARGSRLFPDVMEDSGRGNTEELEEEAQAAPITQSPGQLANWLRQRVAEWAELQLPERLERRQGAEGAPPTPRTERVQPSLQQQRRRTSSCDRRSRLSLLLQQLVASVVPGEQEEPEGGASSGPLAEARVASPPTEDVPTRTTGVGTASALPPLSSPSQLPNQEPEAEEEEGETCPICLQPWTTTGDHRLAALRCGHLFGYTCIERWLTGKGTKCPQCNQDCDKSDIVLLYTDKLRAVANTNDLTLKRTLEREQSLRRSTELAVAHYQLELQISEGARDGLRRELQARTGEGNKLRRELQIKEKEGNGLRRDLEELRLLRSQVALQVGEQASQGAGGTSAASQGDQSGQFSFSTGIRVSKTGGCRVMAFCEPLGCLLASQPSADSSVVPGFGVKTISVATMRPCQYIPIHIKPIRGLSFSRRQESLLLSCSLDGTLKLTSLLTNEVVQTYRTGNPIWSCTWCHDNSYCVYAGLTNGSVRVYDMRKTSTHVQELHHLGSRCPVASLTYLPRAQSSLFPEGGLLTGSLEGGCFWELRRGEYHPHRLPLETGNCTDLQVDPESRCCLVTYRPDRSNPAMRCVLMEMRRAQPQGVCSCSPVQTFTARGSSKMLTKNSIFKHPTNGKTLVCAGDMASASTMVWDAASGSLLQRLRDDLPVLDICPFSANQNHFLASLTDKTVKIHKWE